MTLLEKRIAFTRFAALLPAQAHDLGFDLCYGEILRSDEQAEINAIGAVGRAHVSSLIIGHFPTLAARISNNGKANGVRHSVHQLGLAVDVLLFENGHYLTDSESYKPLGEWWETLHEMCRWGGRFNDGGHFSMEHEGVK